jgi:hypothetical protein
MKTALNDIQARQCLATLKKLEKEGKESVFVLMWIKSSKLFVIHTAWLCINALQISSKRIYRVSFYSYHPSIVISYSIEFLVLYTVSLIDRKGW